MFAHLNCYPFSRSISRRKTVKHKQSMRAVAQQCDIMISYARQEAAEHALQLKERLGKSGYVVYLVGVLVDSTPHRVTCSAICLCV